MEYLFNGAYGDANMALLRAAGTRARKESGGRPGPSKANKRPCKYVIKGIACPYGEENCIFSHNCGPSEQGVKKE